MPKALRLTTVSVAAACLIAACQTNPLMRRDGAPSSPAAPASPGAPAPRHAGGKPALTLSRADATKGQRISITATLDTAGASIAGTQNDIEFDPGQVRIMALPDGTPDCAANRQLGKNATAFSFIPQGCRGNATGCTTVRVLVLSLSNVAPIPNGSALYSCKVEVAANASSGTHRLHVSGVAFSTPDGKGIDGEGVDASIAVR